MSDLHTPNLPCSGCGHAECRCDRTIAGLHERIAALEATLRRCRQGYVNILEFRALTNGRFGNLTRDELTESIAGIDAALAATPEPGADLVARKDSADGAAMITAERQRQVSVEGWTPEHDDEHRLSELSRAAIVYARLATYQAVNGDANIPTDPRGWPWHYDWWKPSPDPIRNLVKAGALIAAEIDRLKRIEAARGGRP